MAPLSPAAALFPLRLFLGGTFVYAGIQKLSDPGYLRPGSSTYIATQLHGFAHGTPGGFLLRAFALPYPKLAGVVVALVEIAIGLLVLAGLFTRVAAAGGLGLNLVLFLTNSWHTSPYFLGSDIVFVFAWLPFVLTGATGQPSVAHAIEHRIAPARARGRPAGGPAYTRRGMLVQAAGLAGLGTLAIGGLSALAKGSYHRPTRKLTAGGPGPRPAAAAHATKPAAHHAKGPKLPSGAVKLAPSSRLPAGQGATYTDPTTGQPDIVIREQGGGVKAFSAVCTHAGCTVGYESGQIVCPCHGATYDPATGAVQSGPATQGLEPRKIVEQGGSIYAVPS
jgi:thiosulfate dehydrogenase [quinone] large subunit